MAPDLLSYSNLGSHEDHFCQILTVSVTPYGLPNKADDNTRCEVMSEKYAYEAGQMGGYDRYKYKAWSGVIEGSGQ
jgi:hypothetical protein